MALIYQLVRTSMPFKLVQKINYNGENRIRITERYT